MRSALFIGCLLFGIFSSPVVTIAVAHDQPSTVSANSPSSSPTALQLTPKERAWLDAHPAIRVFQDPDWPPMEFTDAQGYHRGISSDYLRLIEQRLGIKFRRVNKKTWQDGYRQLIAHDIDMATAMTATPERIQSLTFTKPYMKTPIMILTGTDVTYIDNMRELADKTVAVIDCHAADEWLARDYPKIKLVKVSDAAEGIRLLRKGKVFAYVDNMLIMGYYMSKLRIYDVKIAGTTPYVSGHAMAVRKDWAPLAGILQKALDSISEEERNAIYQKWVPIRYEPGIDYRRLVQSVLIFVTVILILIVWNRKLSAQIEKRKKAEDSLREAEENYRTLIENAPDAIFVQTHGVFVYVNPATLRLYGADSPDQLLGKSVLTVSHPDEHHLILERIEMVNQNKAASLPIVDRRQLKLDGTQLDVQVAAVPLQFKGEKSTLVFVRDISLRKRAEEALLKSESRLRFAMEGANDALWDMYPQEETFYISPRGCEILGYLPEELGLITSRSWRELVHPDHLKLTEQQYYAHLGGLSPMFDVAHELKMKSGDWIWVRTRGKVVQRDASGLPIRMTGTFADISERKRVEDENRKLTEQLNQAQKLESVGRLAGGVAHDFNNMLGVILGYSEILKSELEDDERLSSYVTQIENAATRSQKITQQLLAFSRKQLIAPRPVDINDVIRNSEQMLVRLIGEDIYFQFHPADDLWTVKLDPSQIDQIFINLAVNARDAMPNGGKLIVETANVHIDEFYSATHFESPPGDYVQLAISDTGIGMDRETVERIFEPFFTTKELGKGTGLGLATVYGIIKQNRGFIHVYSEPGHGTTFKIYIPRLTGADAEPVSENKSAVVCGSETILLVEDEFMLRQITAQILESAGYTVLGADSPAQALPFIEDPETHIDLLLTDVVMPGMSGKELGEKARLIRPDLKILFMSGYTTNAVIDQGIFRDSAYFIQKPIRRSELTGKVAEILQQQCASTQPLS